MKSLTTDKAYNDLKIKYDHLYNDHVNLTTELRNRETEIMSLLHEMEDCKKEIHRLVMRNSDIVLENAGIIRAYNTVVKMLMEYGVTRNEIAKLLRSNQSISGRIKQTGKIIEYDFTKGRTLKHSK